MLISEAYLGRCDQRLRAEFRAWVSASSAAASRGLREPAEISTVFHWLLAARRLREGTVGAADLRAGAELIVMACREGITAAEAAIQPGARPARPAPEHARVRSMLLQLAALMLQAQQRIGDNAEVRQTALTYGMRPDLPEECAPVQWQNLARARLFEQMEPPPDVRERLQAATQERLAEQLRGGQAICGARGCGKSVRADGSLLLLCAACKSIAYCSDACQRADWKPRHKAECKALAAWRAALEATRSALGGASGGSAAGAGSSSGR